MNVKYRVSVRPLEGGDSFIYEQFEERDDAVAFHKGLISNTNDGLLDAVPYKTMIIVFEEFLGGQWIATNKKLVVQ